MFLNPATCSTARKRLPFPAQNTAIRLARAASCVYSAATTLVLLNSHDFCVHQVRHSHCDRPSVQDGSDAAV